MPSSLTLNRQFYPTFTANGLRYSDADKHACSERWNICLPFKLVKSAPECGWEKSSRGNKIAVKVIDDRENELLVVKRLEAT